MKELSIEEKAKAYDKAIKRAKDINRENSERGFKPSEDVLYIFPELRESEDERMINFIANELMCLRAIESNSGGECSDRYEELTNAIAWIGKQGDQKPTWSEDDESKFKFLHHLLEQNLEPHGSFRFSDIIELGYVTKQEALDMLKSLKDRVACKPTNEQTKE